MFYPNRRISNIFIDYKLHINKFFKTYCLDEINFQENDLVIDCGANIGELYLAFDEKKIKAFFFVYSSIFDKKPDLLEIYRYFRTNFYEDLNKFYKDFFFY